MKSLSIFIISIVFSAYSYAQEMLGIVNSNFAGNVGIALNPATAVGMPFTQEWNVLSMDLSVHNNYVYFPKGNHGLNKILTGQGVNHLYALDYYTQTPDKKMFGNAYILGPAFSRSYDNYGWAVHLAMRANLSATTVKYHLAKFIWDGFDFEPQHNIEYQTQPYQAVMLQWYELGFTYGRTLLQSKKDLLTFGATLNINIGANAAYIKNSAMDYIVPQSDLLVVNNLTATYGHTILTNNPTALDMFSVKGFGAGVNLGMNYIKNKNERAYYYKIANKSKYTYKIGASLVDLGMIHYMDNARTVKFDGDSTYWQGIDTVKFNGLNSFDQMLNQQFTGSPTGANDKNQFNVFLPSAVSVQFDYGLYRAFYLNATYVQRLYFFKPQIARGNQLSLTARYETPNFEVAIPYSFFEYYKSRVGICFRYKWFFIGTDKIGPYFDLADMDGLDFYFGIKFNNHKNTTNHAGEHHDCPAYQ